MTFCASEDASAFAREAIRSRLRNFGAQTRHMLEPGLETSAGGQVLSAGSCLHASMLATGLWNRFYGGGAVIRGGDGALAQGARDVEGQWKGHYWCEVAIGEDRFILDITADQFGYEPVPYESAAGFEYRAGTQPIVDEVACELATLVGLDSKWLKPKADVLS